MEIIVYQASDLDLQACKLIAQDAAASAAADQVELHVHACQTRAELLQAVREAAHRELASTEQFFPFKTAQGVQLLRLSQVLYFKSQGHRIIAVLTDGSELTGRTIRVPTSKLLEPLMAGGRFYRIFRSTFVNKMHITGISPTRVQLDNGVTMNVSRKYYQGLRQENTLQGPRASV